MLNLVRNKNTYNIFFVLNWRINIHKFLYNYNIAHAELWLRFILQLHISWKQTKIEMKKN